MTASLSARGLVLSIGRTVLLDGVDLTVDPGHRIGLVGPNGVGKSTLLRVLAGDIPVERGEVVRTPPTATVGLLDQEPERRADELVRDHLARRTGVAAAARDLDEATAGVANGTVGADDRYDRALTRWLDLGGADLDARAAQVCADVALDPTRLDQPMTALSGGEAAKVALAVVLLSRHDVLLLDEPTNDLDLDGLARLEDIVLAHPAPMVLVSHDRAFLERTVTDVVELDEHTHRATAFAGGWSAFLEERATLRRHQEEAYSAFTTRRDELTARARRERAWSAKGVSNAKHRSPDGDRVRRSARIEASEQLASRARRTQRAIERLDVVDEPRDGWQLRFSIAATERSGDTVAALDDAVVDLGRFTLGPVDLEVHWADRLAIVGANGSGKTTLVRALFGAIPLTSGRQWQGPGVVVGGVEQARRELADAPRLLDAVLGAIGGTVADARTLLAKFGLVTDHVLRPASSLSPGERTRATLALLQARGVNCLVLDEPTNHLDLAAIEQLEQAIGTFPGTVVLVSHDRRFLEAVELRREVRLHQGRIVSDRER